MRTKLKISKALLSLALCIALVLSTASVMAAEDTTSEQYSDTTATTDESSGSEVEALESLFTTIDLMDASISELSEAMEKGEVTSKELVQMYLDRIEAYDKSLDLNSIISLNPDALEQAEELDKERAEGNVRGTLHGIPIIVKDNYDVEGLPTSAGSVALKDSIAPDDSYVVAQLKEAGAVIIAKANMSEFASSGRNSRSTLGGTVHNPYDTTRTPAGSSGGTAVAVTANFAAAGLGTDTGSSVRAPSTMNNLFGLRVSLGLTSRDGIVPLNLDQDVAGPLCRSAEDLATMLDVISGTDEADSWTEEADSLIPESGYTSYLNEDGLEGKRIGYLQNSFGYYYDNSGELVDDPTEIADCMTGMIDTAKENFVSAGAELVDLSDVLPDSRIYSLRQNTSLGSVFEWDLNNYFTSLGDNAPVKSVYDLVTNYVYGVDYTNVSVKNPSTSLAEMTDPRSTETYSTGITARLNFRETINQILEENDIDAVMFVAYTQPANIEEDSQTNSYSNTASYTSYFGPVAGLPEIAIPMGLAETDEELGYEKEMPMGVNLFTSYGNDEELVEIAYAYEQEAGYENIRSAPDTTPALEDENLNEYLEELMDKVDDIDYSEYTVYPQGKISTMVSNYVAASSVDTSDVYSTYDAAYALAESYDAVMEKLEANKASEDVTEPTTDTSDSGDTSVTTVKLAKAKIKTATRAKSNKKITVTAKKQSKAMGYQIRYSTKKKFKSGYTNDVVKTTTKATLKGLKAKKTYYVKVRSYTVSDNKIVYSKWSKVKTLKAK